MEHESTTSITIESSDVDDPSGDNMNIDNDNGRGSVRIMIFKQRGKQALKQARLSLSRLISESMLTHRVICIH